MSTHTHTSTLARSLKILSLAAAFSLYAATLQAAWITLIQHDFDSEATGNLQGTPVQTFNLSTAHEHVTGNWIGRTTQDALVLANGTFVDDTLKKNAQIRLGDYIDNAKGSSDALFRLTGTYEPTRGWLSMGFSTASTPTDNLHYAEANAAGFATFQYGYVSGGTAGDDVLLRADVVLSGNNLDVTPSSLDGSPATLSIELDYRDWDGAANYGTIRWYLGSDELRSFDLDDTTGANLPRTLLFTNNGTDGGEYSSMSLEQIPEPASGLLVLLGVGFWGFARWRRRK